MWPLVHGPKLVKFRRSISLALSVVLNVESDYLQAGLTLEVCTIPHYCPSYTTPNLILKLPTRNRDTLDYDSSQRTHKALSSMVYLSLVPSAFRTQDPQRSCCLSGGTSRKQGLSSPISFSTALGAGEHFSSCGILYPPHLLSSLSLDPQIFSSIQGLGFGK